MGRNKSRKSRTSKKSMNSVSKNTKRINIFHFKFIFLESIIGSKTLFQIS